MQTFFCSCSLAFSLCPGRPLPPNSSPFLPAQVQHASKQIDPEVIILGNATGRIPNPEKRFSELCQVEMLRIAQLPENQEYQLIYVLGLDKGRHVARLLRQENIPLLLSEQDGSSTSHRAYFFHKEPIKTCGCFPTIESLQKDSWANSP